MSVANMTLRFKIALALRLKYFSFKIACTIYFETEILQPKCKSYFVLIGMRKGLDTFVEVKIDINWINFDTLQSSLSLIKNAPTWYDVM